MRGLQATVRKQGETIKRLEKELTSERTWRREQDIKVSELDTQMRKQRDELQSHAEMIKRQGEDLARAVQEAAELSSDNVKLGEKNEKLIKYTRELKMTIAIRDTVKRVYGDETPAGDLEEQRVFRNNISHYIGLGDKPEVVGYKLRTVATKLEEDSVWSSFFLSKYSAETLEDLQDDLGVLIRTFQQSATPKQMRIADKWLP